MMNRQGRSARSGLMKKALSFVLVLAMILGTVSGSLLMQGDRAYAAGDSTTAPVKTGTYHFASNETTHGNILGTDTYQYCDRLFMGSAYDVDRHLATLSASTALSTASYYNDKNDLERNHATNSQNVRALLKAYGFSDIQTNTYYDREKEENSMGCIVGHKPIRVGSKSYTLLAVIPRSAGYKQEWAGNFTVGTGSIHQGFKAGRDEILRFVKNYMASKKIKGDLKVWITGHSRGGAHANLLGGFFAEGGGGYFSGVTIKPEDVYCYSWATPGTILTNSVTKADALSVSGYRGDKDARYKDDSRGADYEYKGADAATVIDPHTGVYRCIKNCAPGYDIITQLPPKSWDYECYGEELPITDGTDATKEKMKTELNKFAPFAYKEYTEPNSLGENGDEGVYKWKMLDFATLEFVDVAGAAAPTQEEMFEARINEGLARRAKDVGEYVSIGYQETLQSLAGIYGMGMDQFIAGASEDMEAALKAAAFSYLSYAKEQLQAKDSNLTETKAIAMTVEQLLEYITGEPIDPDTFTVDNFFEMFTQYIAGNAERYDVTLPEDPDTDIGELVEDGKLDPEDLDGKTITVSHLRFKSKTADEVFALVCSMIAKAVPEDYIGAIAGEDYDPDLPIDSEVNQNAIRNGIFSILAMCAYGEDADKDHPDPANAESIRKFVYGLLGMFMGDGDFAEIIEAMGKDEEGITDGSANAGEFLTVLMKLLMVEKDEDGDIISTYPNIDAAATGFVKDVIDNGKDAVLASGRYDAGSVYYADVAGHCKTLKKHAKRLRQLLMDLLFYETRDAEHTDTLVSDDLRLASTFVAQYSKIPCAHYNETYVAWMRAQDTPIKYIKPVLGVSKISTKAKTKKKQMLLTWKAARDASDYQIAYRQAGKKWTTKWTGGKTKATIGKMKKNGLYEFKVRAVKRDGSDVVKGKWSKSSYRFYAGVSAKARAVKKAAIIKVKRVKNTSGYQVLYGTDKSLKEKAVRSFKGAAKTRFRIKGLQSRKQYYVRTRPYKMYKSHKYIGILGAKKKVRTK